MSRPLPSSNTKSRILMFVMLFPAGRIVWSHSMSNANLHSWYFLLRFRLLGIMESTLRVNHIFCSLFPLRYSIFADRAALGSSVMSVASAPLSLAFPLILIGA